MTMLSPFRGVCRDLRAEAVEFIAVNASPAAVASTLRVVKGLGPRARRDQP